MATKKSFNSWISRWINRFGDANQKQQNGSSPNHNGFGGPVGQYSFDYNPHDWKRGEFDNIHAALFGLGSNQNGYLAQMLLSMANTGLVSMNEEERNQYMQLLYQGMLNTDQRTYDRELTLDQRKFDWSLLQDQRNYDNPLNALSRLTGAGIGRDAAIELLSGAGSAGAGAGAGAPVSGSASVAPSMPAPSGTYGFNVANTVMNGINTAINMVNCGFDASQAYQQVRLLKSQADMSQNQLNAYNLSGDAYRLLSNEVRGGVISDNDGHLYDSVQSVAAGLEQLAKLGNTTAQDWHATGKIDQLRALAPYAAPLLADFYKQSRAGRDYDIWFADEHAKAEWSHRVNAMTVESLAAGIAKTSQEIDNLITDENWRRETINLIDGQLKLWDAESENARSSAKYQRALARKTQLENIQTNAWMNGSVSVPIDTFVGSGFVQQSGLELFTTQRLQDLKSGALTVLQLNHGEYWKKNVNHMFNDIDNLIALSALNGLKNKTSLDVYSELDDDTKQLIGLSDAYQSAGVFDYLQTLGDINRSTTTINTPIGTKTTNVVSSDVLNSINLNHLPIKPTNKPIIYK